MGKEVELNENPTMVTLPFIDRFHAPCHCDDNDDYYDGYSDMPSFGKRIQHWYRRVLQPSWAQVLGGQDLCRAWSLLWVSYRSAGRCPVCISSWCVSFFSLVSSISSIGRRDAFLPIFALMCISREIVYYDFACILSQLSVFFAYVNNPWIYQVHWTNTATIRSPSCREHADVGESIAIDDRINTKKMRQTWCDGWLVSTLCFFLKANKHERACVRPFLSLF